MKRMTSLVFFFLQELSLPQWKQRSVHCRLAAKQSGTDLAWNFPGAVTRESAMQQTNDVITRSARTLHITPPSSPSLLSSCYNHVSPFASTVSRSRPARPQIDPCGCRLGEQIHSAIPGRRRLFLEQHQVDLHFDAPGPEARVLRVLGALGAF